MKVSWSEIEGANEYHLYRVTGYKYADFIDLEEGDTLRWYIGKTSSTSMTDEKVIPGMEYRYIVECVIPYDESDTWVRIKYLYSDSYVLGIDQVVIQSVKNMYSKSATLTWETVDGADEYVIYRAAKKSGTYKKIATVTTTSYTDKGLVKEKSYYYKIKAVNRNDFGIVTEGAYSQKKEIKISK